MQIFLSGPSGAGKSAVGAALGEATGRPVVRLEALFEARVGRSFAEARTSVGRVSATRELSLLIDGLPSSAVLVLGPSMVAERSLRHRLLREACLVTLTAPIEPRASRLGLTGEGAAGLDGLDTSAFGDLAAVRAEAYAEAHAVLDTASRSAEELAVEVLRWADERPVVVPLGERTYRVEIGRGVRDRLGERVVSVTNGPVVLVHDGPDRPWPAEARAALARAGREPVVVVLPTGEEHKTMETAARVWDAALEAGIDRGACVVGVGGGVVGDLTAFAASTLLRGVALGQVPTTLLSMVDSSVGGKTGFNRPAGKNLVGTFYQPRFVLCDVETLATLPAAERIAGLAEVAKSAWLDGEAAVALLEAEADALAAGDLDATIRAVRMSVQLKASVVQQDETESGARMLLNLGHTVGHGLEAAAGYRNMRHGEGVALGMVAALRVGAHLGRVGPEVSSRLVRLLAALGLPTDLDAALSERALGFIASDKKRRGSLVRFVVPAEPGKTEITPLSLEEIKAAVTSGTA